MQAAELESVQASLAERERELGAMQEALAERDRRVKEVELKLLSVTQEMAANAGDFAQRMRDKEEEMQQYKVSLICEGPKLESNFPHKKFYYRR